MKFGFVLLIVEYQASSQHPSYAETRAMPLRINHELSGARP